MTLQTIKDVLRREKLAPSKQRGQNFLIHAQTAARIVALAGVEASDTVIELGVGLGSLTEPLAHRVKKVIGLEIDAGIISWQSTSGNLAANVTLLHQDLLQADFEELARQSGGRLKIVANLPYSISNPLLFKLLDNRGHIEWVVLMLQKEVAHRLVAVPGTKQYGILSVLMAGAASIVQLLTVGPEQFHPRPKVDSAVVKITFHPQPERVRDLPAHDHGLLRRIVKSAFQKRRKTLQNALSTSPFIVFDREAIHAALTGCGIDPVTRAERLTIEQYVALTRALAAVRD